MFSSVLRFFNMHKLLMVGMMLHLIFTLLLRRALASVIVCIACTVALVSVPCFMLQKSIMPVLHNFFNIFNMLQPAPRGCGPKEQRSSGAAEQRSSGAAGSAAC